MARGQTAAQASASALAKSTAAEGSSAAKADSAAAEPDIGAYRKMVQTAYNVNPWEDPAYQSQLRTRAATVASGTEHNIEEKINEEGQRTGGYNASAREATIAESRRGKTRDLNAVLTQQGVDDHDKFQAQKIYAIGAQGAIPDWYLKKYGVDRGLQGSATGAAVSAANGPQSGTGQAAVGGGIAAAATVAAALI